MGKCSYKSKSEKRVVTLPGSYVMTHTPPGPNCFIKVQLCATKDTVNLRMIKETRMYQILLF